jgi:hypothetical protein
MLRATLIMSVAIATCAGGCASTDASPPATPVVVTDTLGFKFNVDCSSGLCVLGALTPTLSAQSCAGGGGTDIFVLMLDPILAISALRVPSGGGLTLSAADPSHPVACTTDSDCLAPGISLGSLFTSYACQSGLCVLQQSCVAGACTPWDGMLLTYDVLALCQADLPWPTSCPYLTSPSFAARVAEVAAICGASPNCARVPADCRQLTGGGIDGGASSIDGGV